MQIQRFNLNLKKNRRHLKSSKDHIKVKHRKIETTRYTKLVTFPSKIMLKLQNKATQNIMLRNQNTQILAACGTLAGFPHVFITSKFGALTNWATSVKCCWHCRQTSWSPCCQPNLSAHQRRVSASLRLCWHDFQNKAKQSSEQSRAEHNSQEHVDPELRLLAQRLYSKNKQAKNSADVLFWQTTQTTHCTSFYILLVPVPNIRQMLFFIIR